jgi:ABC-2 type transport system permease protein
MSRVLTIAKREVDSLFVSPVAYLVLCFFLFWMSLVFWFFYQSGSLLEIRTLMDWSRFGLFFAVPLITMGIFADEYRSGRIEMLRTSPITEFDLLFGKYIGAMAFYLFLVASTLIYPIIFRFYGRMDLGQIISSYIGMFFLGLMFVAVGLFFSACTREQIIAALAGMITLGALTILSFFSSKLPIQLGTGRFAFPLRAVGEYMAVGTHVANFTKGSIELSSIIYFTGIAGFFLLLTYLLLESRKWR